MAGKKLLLIGLVLGVGVTWGVELELTVGFGVGVGEDVATRRLIVYVVMLACCLSVLVCGAIVTLFCAC